MGTPDAAELTDLLHRRHSLVARLRDGPCHKPELTAACDVSRSTVDRGVRELADAGLVERADGGFALTTFGHVAASAFDALQDELGRWADAGDLLSAAPAEPEVGRAVLRGGRVEYVPAFPRPLVERILAPADRARVAFPVVPLVYGTVEYADEAGAPTDAEFVLDRQVVAAVEEYYPAEFESLVTETDVAVRTTDAARPFCFGVLADADERWLVAIFRLPDGTLGVVTNYDREAVRWGETAYRRYRADADRYVPEEERGVVETRE